MGTKEYQIRLTLDLVDEALESTGLDLLGEDASTVLVNLCFDQRSLGKVLWALCESQAAKATIGRKSFFGELDSETLANGWSALVDAVVFFTPSHRRAALRMAFEKQMAAVAKGMEAIQRTMASEATNQVIDGKLAALETEMQATIARAFEDTAAS